MILWDFNNQRIYALLNANAKIPKIFRKICVAMIVSSSKGCEKQKSGRELFMVGYVWYAWNFRIRDRYTSFLLESETT